jgi:hypothetical protein
MICLDNFKITKTLEVIYCMKTNVKRKLKEEKIFKIKI